MPDFLLFFGGALVGAFGMAYCGTPTRAEEADHWDDDPDGGQPVSVEPLPFSLAAERLPWEKAA